MKMWQGRFTEDTKEQVHQFNASLDFDINLFKYDVMGSIAHCKMLEQQNILTHEESCNIILALENMLDEWEKGIITLNPQAEDVHMAVEEELIKRLGDVGKKIHTARSRNDQVALDLRMYTKTELTRIMQLVESLVETLMTLSHNHKDTIMPGYTHLQKAQPITLAHHLMAYVAMFTRDYSRLKDCFKRTDVLPLGSGALATSTYPLDREYVAKLLSFEDMSMNSLDAVSDRDFIIETSSCCSQIMMHLSRLSEELILWHTQHFNFITFQDGYCTGSSMMPQKKNPDIPELIRGKTGRVYGCLMSILTVMKGLPLAYNKDLQEDKELFFDTVKTTKDCLNIMDQLIHATTFNKEKMASETKKGYLNATDLADYLVKKKVPFRDAHAIVGSLVLYAIKEHKELEELTYEELKAHCPLLDEDINEHLNITQCVNERTLPGGPSPQAIDNSIAYFKEVLQTLK